MVIKESVIKKKTEILHKAKVAENLQLSVLALPVVVLLFIFSYLPMGGLVLAFKDYRYDKGILGSDWVGLKNFDYFLKSLDAVRISRNTLGYGILFLTVGTLSAVTVALLLFEVKRKGAIKFYQTAYTMPRFLSWVIVSYITYIFLSPSSGILNSLIELFGGTRRDWFSNPFYWPVILTVVNVWKNVGLDCIMYYAALMGIDSELFDAAKVDGANRLQQIWYIALPSIKPTITILCILSLSNIFRGDFGLFFQIPRDVGLLYPATDIIDTYIYRGVRAGDVGATTAVGLFQSVFGFAAVMVGNAVVKKLSPEDSLF